MFKSLKIAAVSVVLAVGGIAATPVLADPTINGSITITGLVANTPPPPSTSIVSALLSIDHAGDAGVVNGGLGDFGPLAFLIAAMTDWTFAGPFPNIISVGGFTFDLVAASLPVGQPPFNCQPGSCADGLTIGLIGVVSAAGYDDTIFTGSLLLSGSCVSAAPSTQCTAPGLSSYTYSISASGRSQQVPEPTTLGLLAIALLGLGVMRRKMS